MTFFFRMMLVLSVAFYIAGCGGGDDHDHDHNGADSHGHEEGDPNAHDDDHSNATELPDAVVGDMTLKLQQAGGKVNAGKESILLITLPEDDKGATIVRTWIGSDDRTLSGGVKKAHYIAAEKFYDVHVVAPNPLPDGAMWWIEIEKPDGTKAVGSTKPILE